MTLLTDINHQAFPKTCSASRLDEIPSVFFKHIDILSLDCFDTLLWRHVYQPHDIFYAFSQQEVFQAAGLNAGLRMKLENLARLDKSRRLQGTEVNLEEIYRYNDSLDNNALQAAIETEIEEEIKHGFIYGPMRNLLSTAKKNGLITQIVSDTYLTSAQLKQLLFTVDPELESLIDHVYTSCDFGTSKQDKLWPKLIKSHVKGKRILHIGDNLVADSKVPSQHGVHTLHLQQYPDVIKRLRRQRYNAASLLLPEVRNTDPLPDLFHGFFGETKRSLTSANEVLGYLGLGPILYTFSRYLIEEVNELKLQSPNLKTVFLMRDGHLPKLSCDILLGHSLGLTVNINRFTAQASALDSKKSIEQCLRSYLDKDNLSNVAKQLLLPASLAEKFITEAKHTDNPPLCFYQKIMKQSTICIIKQQSAKFRRRLYRHLQAKVNLQPGDTLLCVDLGYHGTIPKLLTALFKKEFDITLTSRYLISVRQPTNQKQDTKSLISPDWADDRLITTLIKHIALLEALSKAHEPSIIDYTEDGHPIYGSKKGNQNQIAVTKEAQQACLAFLMDLNTSSPNHWQLYTPRQLALSATIDIGRLIYFPLEEELKTIEGFNFDINFGINKEIDIYNVQSALESMRHRWLFFRNDIANIRSNHPAELRHLGVDLSVTYLASIRYGFECSPKEANYRREALSVLFAKQQQSHVKTLEAHATFDGYFAVDIPIGDFDVAIMLSQSYQWIQIDSIKRIPQSLVGSVYHDSAALEMTQGKDIIYDNIEEKASQLFEIGENGLIYFPAMAKTENKYICRFVFRPLVKVTDI